jgi:flavin-dependent dehydrogenase
MSIDVLVAGAGPAGLATALYAVAAGWNVTVVDPRPSPIDKACGEGLMPGAVAALSALDVPVNGYPLHGIRYRAGERTAVSMFRDGVGLGVRRTELQSALLAAAVTRGVQVVAGTVTSVEQDESGVRAAGLRARYLVAADGLHSPIARQLGLEVSPRSRPRWGVRRHFARAPWSDLVEVHWSAHSEAYVTPVAENLVGIAVLTGSRGGFDEQLRAFPALAALVSDAPALSVRGAGPLRRRTSRRVAGRILLVGDAAGYVDALTGEGIAVSFGCAAALVDSLVRGDPAGYERAWRARSRRYRALTTSLLWASRRSAVRRVIVPGAARLPSVFDAAVAQLAR